SGRLERARRRILSVRSAAGERQRTGGGFGGRGVRVLWCAPGGAWTMGIENDLLLRTAFGWNYALTELLQQRGVPPVVLGVLGSVLPLGEVVLVVVVLAVAAAGVDRLWAGRRRGGATWWVLVMVQAAAGLCALGLLSWIYLHPSAELIALACRCDYLAFAILAGLVLRLGPLHTRLWALVVLSVILVCAYVGPRPVGGVLLGSLLGFAATRWSVTDRPGRRIVVQAIPMAAVFAWLWETRSSTHLWALQGWGLYGYALLRHVSYVVESRRGVPATLCGYLCFLLFYPSAIGAVEVYNEFWERNLSRDRAREYRRAAIMVAKGAVLLSIGVAIPMTQDRVTESVGFAAMWRNALVLFVRAACATMGIWNQIEG